MCGITCIPPPASPHLSCSVWPVPRAAAPSLQSSRPASSLQPAMVLLTPCSPWGSYGYDSIHYSSQTLLCICAPCTPHNPPYHSQTTLLSRSDTVFPFPSLSRLLMEAFPLLPSQFFKAAQPTQVFPVLFYQKTSLVCKWLKYSIPPTFFCWIFYYLVAMVPKACGGWLAFCPSVLAAQTRVSLHCPCSPKYTTGAELLLAQIKAQVSGSCTPPRVGWTDGSSLKSREQTWCFKVQKYFLIVKYENIFLLASTNCVGPENQSILRISRIDCRLGELTENIRENICI